VIAISVDNVDIPESDLSAAGELSACVCALDLAHYNPLDSYIGARIDDKNADTTRKQVLSKPVIHRDRVLINVMALGTNLSRR
jgi:hypothetical protein